VHDEIHSLHLSSLPFLDSLQNNTLSFESILTET
jgi:hypothetical protein